jgi:glycosyltransferase involved in cell wall biosynthesis
LKVLEILNTPPGETFLQQHALAINNHLTNIELVWAFTQTNKRGRITLSDFGDTKCYAWPNYNLLPTWKQAIVKARYLGKSLDALYKPQLRLLKKIKPDLVHFHFSTLAVKYAHLCMQLNIPYTFSIRGSDLHSLNSSNDELYIKTLIHVTSNAKAIHSVSEGLKHSFELLTENTKTPQVIRTTVDDSWQEIIRDSKANLLISIGRLTWQKGFPDLLLAIKNLTDHNFPVQLVIIGEGPQRQELEYMIRDLQLTGNVSLAGKQDQPEIKNWFAKAQAFVLSSIAEGFPNVLAEAMLAGVPVITSNCGGIPELIENEKHAFMYETGNIDDLTSQLKKIITLKDSSSIVNCARQLSTQTFSHVSHATFFNRFWQQ